MATEEIKQTNDTNLNTAKTVMSDIGIVDIINMMLTFWWFIVILAVLVGGATYTYFKISAVPEYKSTAKIYINTEGQQTSTDVNAGALINAGNLLPTYIDVLQSNSFLQNVSDDLDNKYSETEIKSMTNMEAVIDTNIISLEVVNADAHVSYLIASSIVNNAPTEIARVFGGGSTKLTEYPKEATKAEPSHTARNAVIGGIIGAVIAMLIIFLVNLFDTRVKNKDELIEKYNLPILGEMPSLELE